MIQILIVYVLQKVILLESHCWIYRFWSPMRVFDILDFRLYQQYLFAHLSETPIFWLVKIRKFGVEKLPKIAEGQGVADIFSQLQVLA